MKVSRFITLLAVLAVVTGVAIFALRGVSTSSEQGTNTNTLSQNVVSTPTPSPIDQTNDYKQGFILGQKHGTVFGNNQTSGAPTEEGFELIIRNWQERSEYSSLDTDKFKSGYEAGFTQKFEALRAKATDRVPIKRLTFVNVWKVKEGTRLYGPDGVRVGTACRADPNDGRIEYVEWITGNVLVETSDEMNKRGWKMQK